MSIQILNYDPEWPALFESLRGFILGGFTDSNVIIEHVGSTAVPGLAAKPIIDIDVAVSAADMAGALGRLLSLGYQSQGDLGIAGRVAFNPPPDEVYHHLYLVELDNSEFLRHIAFRDFLRSHPEDMRAYGELKRLIAAQVGNDRIAYSAAKTDFIVNILQLAQSSDTE